jgi:hypothetical protein
MAKKFTAELAETAEAELLKSESLCALCDLRGET